MPRVRLAMLLSCSLLLVGLDVNGRAAAPPTTLTVSGAGSVTVDVTLPAVVLDWSQLVTPSGANAALYFEALGVHDADRLSASGALVASSTARGGSEPAPALALTTRETGASPTSGTGSRFGLVTRLAAGRYRLHVISAGQTRMTLPARGLTHSVRVTASRRSQDKLLLRTLSPVVPGSGVASANLPLPSAGPMDLTRTMTVLATRATAYRLSSEIESCRIAAGGQAASCEQQAPADASYVVEESEHRFNGVGPVSVPAGATVVTTVASLYNSPAGGATQFARAVAIDTVERVQAITVFIRLAR